MVLTSSTRSIIPVLTRIQYWYTAFSKQTDVYIWLYLVLRGFEGMYTKYIGP